METTPRRPVFIVGSTRSGTKLISRVIGGHPDNFLITEHREKFHIPEDKSGICEEFLWMNNFAYEHWAKNGNPLVRVPRYNEQDIAVMCGLFLAAADNKRLIIKNPQNIMRIKFLRKMFPDALYVFCVRNPWQGAQSRLAAGNTNYQLASQKNFDLPDDLLLKSVFSWKESIDIFEQEKDENWCAVRYEDVVFKTKETIASLFDFLGMESSGQYFEKACTLPRDLKHTYYPVKKAFRKSKFKKEIMDIIQQGCAIFPYEQSIDSMPGDAWHYYFSEKKYVNIKKIKAGAVKFGKKIMKKIVQIVFDASGGQKRLYVGPLVFSALSASASAFITQDYAKLSRLVANAKKGESASFTVLQMQYQRLRHYNHVVVLDSKGVAWVLLKNIAFSPSDRHNYTLTGEVEFIKHD